MGHRQLEMIIGITGTTAGIGRAILQLPYNFVEFNRTDGDINDVSAVYDKLKDCDVFINNAWHLDCQTKLLKYFFDKWKNKTKKIISIGSSVATYQPSGSGYGDYVGLKRELREAHCNIVNLKTTACKSFLINPGVTDTKLVASRECKKLTTQDVSDMIKFVLEHKVYIPEIYFYVE
jgi:hypothetical protein